MVSCKPQVVLVGAVLTLQSLQAVLGLVRGLV